MSADGQPNVSPVECPHCGTEVPAGAREAPYCCAGCRSVHALIAEQGLARYYDLARGTGVPASPASSDRSHAWLDPILAAVAAKPGALATIDLDLQGIHCAACVWLIDQLFRRRPGNAGLRINPALGKARITWVQGRFDLDAFLREVESFGYRFGPSRKTQDPASRDLPMRIGISAALTLNVMMFSLSFYLGLTPSAGRIYVVFGQLCAWLSTAAVAIGGWPFFKAAVQGLRRRVLHLDLPIAVGIGLAFTTSMLRSHGGRGGLAYFDTLDVFVTLMLVGRWLQQRLLDRNRRYLLEDAGAEGLHARREENGIIAVRRMSELKQDDLLVIPPGDLLPVDAELLSTGGAISTDWISGESDPKGVVRGARLPAGSFNAGREAIRVRAAATFADSPLPQLLQSHGGGSKQLYAQLTEYASRLWVPSVMLLAGLGWWIWRPAGSVAALDVTSALLIVTCPCALGIALPLAGELALGRLRRSGVFVRSGDLLDRALRIRSVLFDKTGTLTLGDLELVNRSALAALAEPDRDALNDLAVRSNHPVNRCLARELAELGARFTPDAATRELPGKGIELRRDDRLYRLGRREWAAGQNQIEEDDATIFTRDGETIATFQFQESIRPDAREELATLKSRGLDLWLISGDSTRRVEKAARVLGIPPDHILSGQTPEDKARAVKDIGASTALFVGDGINDSLAFETAGASCTPAIDRPVLPGKADFFLLGAGISGVRAVLETAQVLRAAMRRILFAAVVYNAAAVIACLGGTMTPLRAAVAMPLSSIAVILIAVASFRPGTQRETAESCPVLDAERAYV